MAFVLDKTSVKRESATSSAVALIMILAVLAVCAGVWALLVVPEEVRTEEEIDAEAVLSILSDIVLMSDRTDYTIYYALPTGTLHIENFGEIYTTFGDKIPITALIYSHSGESSFGIMAGGVWRMDFGKAAWVVYPDISYDKGVLKLSLPVFSGEAAYGSSRPIPLGIGLENHTVHTVSRDSVRFSITSNEEWATDLFETLFRETAFSYENILDLDIYRNRDIVTADISAKSGDICLEIDEKKYMINLTGIV